MYRLLEFLRSIYITLLFLLLEGGALVYYAHSDSYTQAKLLGYSSRVMGGAGSLWGGVTGYFSLRSTNEELLSQINRLNEEVETLRSYHTDSLMMAESYIADSGINYMSARVVSNSTNKLRNHLIINKGVADGVRRNMAVITPLSEMVGIVVNCTENYSVVMSVLNTNFRSSGRLENDPYACSIYWSGMDRYSISLRDLSKYARISVGSKVVSTGFSQIFPEGVIIGEVESYSLNKGGTAYEAEVRLAAEISGVSSVLIVNNAQQGESRQLLDEVEGAVNYEEEIL